MNNKKEPVEKEDLSDHDRIIRIDAKLSYLCNDYATHKSRHWAVEIAVITIIIAGVISYFFN